MAKISARQALVLHGIEAIHERRETGELRFRLRAADGNAYIRTEAMTSGWQNSHFHKRTFETYIVERGWMALAVANNDLTGPPTVSILEPQQLVTTPVGLIHNVYLPAGATIHTVKHGGTDGDADWHGAPAFDEIVRQMEVPQPAVP